MFAAIGADNPARRPKSTAALLRCFRSCC